MMRYFILFFVFFITIISYSHAEVKIVIDTTGWTTQEKSLMEAIAYRIVWENGEDIIPIKNGDTLIFSTLSDITKEKIKSTLLDRIRTEYEASEIRRIAEVQKVNDAKIKAKTKLKALGLTDDEIESLKD